MQVSWKKIGNYGSRSPKQQGSEGRVRFLCSFHFLSFLRTSDLPHFSFRLFFSLLSSPLGLPLLLLPPNSALMTNCVVYSRNTNFKEESVTDWMRGQRKEGQC